MELNSKSVQKNVKYLKYTNIYMFFLPFRKKNVLLQTIYDIPRAGMPISINKH